MAGWEYQNLTALTIELVRRHARNARTSLTFVALFFPVALLLAAILVRQLESGRVSIARAGGPAPGSLVTEQQPVQIELSATTIRQGGAFAVHLSSSALVAAVITFHGRDYPMVNEGSRWYAVVGIGQNIGTSDVLPIGDYPVSVTYQLSGVRSVETAQGSIAVTPADFPVDDIEVDSTQEGLLDPALAASEAAQLQQAYGAFTPQRLWTGPFIEPVSGEITTVFGARRSYQGGPATGSHSGVDIGVLAGTPVAASAAGRVAWTGELSDRGRGVIVDHGLGVFTGYFHMSVIQAQVGQSVRTGDIVGLAGSTGLSTGPHVHWEVVVGGQNIDGIQFMQATWP